MVLLKMATAVAASRDAADALGISAVVARLTYLAARAVSLRRFAWRPLDCWLLLFALVCPCACCIVAGTAA